MSPITRFALVIAVVALPAAIAIPNFIKSRTTRAWSTCVDINLPALAEAKQRWAEENEKSNTVVPEMVDILPYLKHPYLKEGRVPECPGGGTYIIGPIGSKPYCSLTDHQGWTPVKVNAFRRFME